MRLFDKKPNIGSYFKIVPGAVFVNGKSAIPQWVTEKIWQVKSIKNNIVILGDSIDGIKSMNGSPIDIKYTKKIKVK